MAPQKLPSPDETQGQSTPHKISIAVAEGYSFGVTLDQIDSLDLLIQTISAHGDVVAGSHEAEFADHTPPLIGQAIYDGVEAVRAILDEVENQPLGPSRRPLNRVGETRATYEAGFVGAAARPGSQNRRLGSLHQPSAFGYIALGAIAALAKDGKMTGKDLARAVKQYKIDVEKVNPDGLDAFHSVIGKGGQGRPFLLPPTWVTRRLPDRPEPRPTCARLRCRSARRERHRRDGSDLNDKRRREELIRLAPEREASAEAARVARSVPLSAPYETRINEMD